MGANKEAILNCFRVRPNSTPYSMIKGYCLTWAGTCRVKPLWQLAPIFCTLALTSTVDAALIPVSFLINDSQLLLNNTRNRPLPRLQDRVT